MSERDGLADWHKLVTVPARLPSIPVLVVAATELELAKIMGVETLCCGIGPVEAAIATTAALAATRPPALLHIGIAGARTLQPGSLAIGAEAVYCDLCDHGSRIERVLRAEPDPVLLAAARKTLPGAAVVPIATAARVGAGHACADVEAMEGFAVLRAAEAAGVPAIELRAVSNAFDAPARTGASARRWPRSTKRCPCCSRPSVPELPPPLPPGQRTVGQLIAETIRAYGNHFWSAIPLGVPLVLIDQLSVHRSSPAQIVIYWLVGPLVVAAYVRACTIVYKAPANRTAYLARVADLPAVSAASRALPRPGPRLVRIHRSRGPCRGRRAAGAPTRFPPRPGARPGELRVLPRLHGRPGDRRRRRRSDPRDASAIPERGQRASCARPLRSRAQPAPLPRRRDAVRRPGGQDRLAATPAKETTRCRPTSSSRA